MGPLRLVAAALALCAAGPAAASNTERWRPIIAEASLRFGIPETWIERVMRAESGGNTMLNGRPITSRAGAMGLMQVMPGTYRAMARAHGLGPDPHSPRDNILAGTAYLRAMYDRYGYPGLFAAYNAGPGRYDQYLRSGRPLPGETRAYLAQLTGGGPAAPVGVASVVPERAIAPVPKRRTDTIFFAIRGAGRDDSGADSAPRSGLFVTPPGSRNRAE